MSGLCGWISREPGALPIAQMAAGLARTSRAPLRSAANGMGALALAGGPDAAGLYHEDGLLVAHWGERVEALARLWRTHGAKACAALSGHFAFAILDERRGEALLAVDRCATRPLYYRQVGHTLVFASSADALALHPGAGREVDPQALYDYLYFHAVPGQGSIYRGQRRLDPGEFLHVHGGRIERARYWRLRFQERQPQAQAALKDELADTLAAAVEASVGQERVGVMLGGGAGSAALAALLPASSGAQAPSFAAGPAWRGQLVPARRAARQLGTRHQQREIGADELADAIPLVAAHFDQPCGDAGALAMYYCALLAREAGVARLLCANGAGVLFARGPRYQQQLRLSRYERLPSALRQLVLEPLLFRLAGGLRAGPLAAARERIELAMQPLPARLLHANLLDGYGAASVLDPGLLEQVDPTVPQAALQQSWWLVQGRDQVNRMIGLDLEHVLAGHALPLATQACALAGVEAAFPWLADAMVAFAARIEPRHKGAGDLLPAALRARLGGRLARACGQPFELPLGQWLQSDARLRALAFDSLADLRGRRIVRAGFIDALLQRLPEDPARHGRMVWLLMMLEQWHAQRRPAATQAPAHAQDALAEGGQGAPCAY